MSDGVIEGWGYFNNPNGARGDQSREIRASLKDGRDKYPLYTMGKLSQPKFHWSLPLSKRNSNLNLSTIYNIHKVLLNTILDLKFQDWVLLLGF